MNIATFQKTVWSHYDQNKRDMPWRSNTDPYWILVSEIMLQQTQASRVLPKFESFVTTFPTINSLSSAPLEQVLKQWVGLGYNRRAKFLWQAAIEIVEKHGGTVPADRAQLEALPGIGPNTAGAILAYAYNQPVVYIETNIRTVYLHHFFPNQTNIPDTKILPLIEKSLPKQCDKHAHSSAVSAFSLSDASEPYTQYSECASEKKRGNCAENSSSTESSALGQAGEVCMFREWYWALMDYGVYLKKTLPNPSRASKHHAKQSKFEGSDRQIRGRIIRILSDRPRQREELLLEVGDHRAARILQELCCEGLVRNSEGTAHL